MPSQGAMHLGTLVTEDTAPEGRNQRDQPPRVPAFLACAVEIIFSLNQKRQSGHMIANDSWWHFPWELLTCLCGLSEQWTGTRPGSFAAGTLSEGAERKTEAGVGFAFFFSWSWIGKPQVPTGSHLCVLSVHQLSPHSGKFCSVDFQFPGSAWKKKVKNQFTLYQGKRFRVTAFGGSEASLQGWSTACYFDHTLLAKRGPLAWSQLVALTGRNLGIEWPECAVFCGFGNAGRCK